MKYVLGFDFETTGLVAGTDRIIEVGAVLWDWERGTPVKILSELCWQDNTPPVVPDLITKLTGISTNDLLEFAKPTSQVINEFLKIVPEAVCVMAHNAPFDHGFLKAEVTRLGLETNYVNQWVSQLVDTRVDLPIDNELHKSRALVHLAATHGFLNPFAHRAVFDVLTMIKVASNYELSEIIERSKSPMIELTAHVSFEQKDLAKQAGFHWNPTDKSWRMKIKTIDLRDDMGWAFRTSAREIQP